MCAQEQTLGNFSKQKSLQVKGKERKSMILLMEKLYKSQQYKLETFYLSMSIADNHLAKLASLGHQAPCLKKLGVSCLILAAKIE